MGVPAPIEDPKPVRERVPARARAARWRKRDRKASAIVWSVFHGVLLTVLAASTGEPLLAVTAAVAGLILATRLALSLRRRRRRRSTALDGNPSGR